MEKTKIILATGIILVIVISIVNEIDTFFHMFEHIYNDLTEELVIHLYILGWVLVVYAVAVIAKSSFSLRTKRPSSPS